LFRYEHLVLYLIGRSLTFLWDNRLFTCLKNDDIYIRYSDFYDEFLQSFDITKSLQCLFFRANPNKFQKYSFVNAPEFFRRIYKNYLETQFTTDAIKKKD